MDTTDLLIMLGLVLASPAVGAVRTWRAGRPGRGRPSTDTLGRLRQAGWFFGLVVLVLAITSMRWAYPNHHGLELLILVSPVAAVGFRPRLVYALVPAGLIALSCYGLSLARSMGFSGLVDTSFAFMPVDAYYSVAYYAILPVAYALLLLAVWLAWRATNFESPAARLVLGRLADPATRARPWALLMFPVIAMISELLTPTWPGGMAGAAWSAAVLAGTFLAVRRRPDLTASLATGGILLLGLASFAAANSWFSWPFPKAPDRYMLDGFVPVPSQVMTGQFEPRLAVAQGLLLIGFGVWLAPRTIPQARKLLGWADTDLSKRVRQLTETRAVAVDTAAAELRRLERDLHDGAQARLVAPGMTLSAAERLIPTSPEAAAVLVSEARQTSARALTELRELVRGVHPPVLADRGLGDALRALALDTPMKIETDIDLPGRLAAPVETACYFAAAEVLTNAAKHSGAREGRISARHADGILRVEVTDFGVGGADPARGTGLAGVERRLTAFDGIVAVSSPVGGPTMVVMEVPCASSLQKISSC